MDRHELIRQEMKKRLSPSVVVREGMKDPVNQLLWRVVVALSCILLALVAWILWSSQDIDAKRLARHSEL